MNRSRTRGRHQALHDRLSATYLHQQQTSNGAPEVSANLLDAIRQLPDGEREAFMLVAWEGLDAGRGAAALGCSATAFRVRVHRARRKLSSTLAAIQQAGSTPTDARTPLEDYP